MLRANGFGNGQEAASALASAPALAFAVVVADITQTGASRTYDLLADFQQYGPGLFPHTTVVLYSAASENVLRAGSECQLLSMASLAELNRQARVMLEAAPTDSLELAA